MVVSSHISRGGAYDDGESRVRLSVLDRLMDSPPGSEGDWRNAGDAFMLLRRAVRRDLEALLNARRRFDPVPPRFTALANSCFTFGLPDFTAGAMNDAASREALRKEIERSIRQFEPRLAQVVVTLVANPDDFDQTLRFHIEAILHADPAPEPVNFDTLVNPATTDVEIKGDYHG
jgi:type VI secretion system protein ImpF